ncbi:MAG TPA: CAP domain-containing protein, partial [Thermomicrobiales bacterium]|nr:CAP domain-containing protein [Thermomicrobiales bacterium]
REGAMKRLAVVLFACALAMGLVAPAARVHAAYAPDDQAQAIVGLINDYRGSFGLQPVSLVDDLGEAAQHHSDDMAANNYFSHTLADGSSPDQNIRNFGFTGSTWGENIAAGMSSAADALQTWENSPEHDSILRDPDFQEIGIGRAYNANSQYGWYWTADFGGGEQSAPATTTDAAPPAATDASNTTSPVTTTTDINGVKTKTENGVSVHKQQAPSDGGNSTANAEPSPIVMGDLNLRGTTTTIVVPPSSSTGDAAGGNNVNDTPPPPPPAAPVANGGGTSQSGRATASGSDGSITYNASDNGDGNQVITTDGSGGGNGGNGGNGGGNGDAAPQNPNQQVAQCSDFASWYDAQNAYEAAGGTNADPALVNSLDPDWDGIACEEMMTS